MERVLLLVSLQRPFSACCGLDLPMAAFFGTCRVVLKLQICTCQPSQPELHFTVKSNSTVPEVMTQMPMKHAE